MDVAAAAAAAELKEVLPLGATLLGEKTQRKSTRRSGDGDGEEGANAGRSTLKV
jgi:hypothetical protein